MDTGKTVLRQMMTAKDRNTLQHEVSLLQFLYHLLKKSPSDDLLQIKSPLLALFKDGLQLNLAPPALFVMYTILNIYVHEVPVPEERRARRELQVIILYK